jgi:hypothetical protein
MSENACPSCKEPFACALSRESHYKLYPTHHNGQPQPVNTKEEAVLTETPKRYNRKREEP